MCGFQYVYTPIEKECETDGQSYIGYGIRVYNSKNQEERIYQDISINKRKIEELAELCNILQLDPIHIEDVIEDMLV